MSERIKDIGEFGLIGRIQHLLSREGFIDPAVTLSLGDDSASFQPREGCEILVTCDSMVEGRHYVPGKMNPMEIGRRAMTMNISDIGAMGGVPRYALISLGLNEDTPVLDIEEMYRGFLDVLRDFEASTVGGNLTKVDGAEFIDITLIGEVEQGNYDTYTPLRIDAMPDIAVHIVPSTDAPTGVGEPGVPSIGPAVANAIAAASGRRIRVLPMAKSIGA